MSGETLSEQMSLEQMSGDMLSDQMSLEQISLKQMLCAKLAVRHSSPALKSFFAAKISTNDVTTFWRPLFVDGSIKTLFVLLQSTVDIYT